MRYTDNKTHGQLLTVVVFSINAHIDRSVPGSISSAWLAGRTDRVCVSSALTKVAATSSTGSAVPHHPEARPPAP